MLDAFPSPYRIPETLTGGEDGNRHVLAALPCTLPLTFTFLVFAIAVLHRDLGFRGAILHDFTSLLGALFSVAAYLYMTALLWAPAGLFLSVVLSGINTAGKHRLLHPMAYVGCCMVCVAMLVFDPSGSFAYFLD